MFLQIMWIGLDKTFVKNLSCFDVCETELTILIREIWYTPEIFIMGIEIYS